MPTDPAHDYAIANQKQFGPNTVPELTRAFQAGREQGHKDSPTYSAAWNAALEAAARTILDRNDVFIALDCIAAASIIRQLKTA